MAGEVALVVAVVAATEVVDTQEVAHHEERVRATTPPLTALLRLTTA